MANIYVTGPVHIYVSIPAETFANSGTGAPSALTYPSSIYYLGTGEQAPTIAISPLYSPVANDIAGDQAPIDTQYQGRVGSATCTLTRWNEAVMASLDTMGDISRGVDAIDDVGTLMQFEGRTFHVWFHFPYYSKFSAFAMPAGYHFCSCRLLPYQISPGTKAKKRLFAIECDRVYEPSTGKFFLFDEVMTTVPSIPPTSVSGLVV